MAKWTEVNAYTGRPVDEDAPTNFAGAGSGVDMNPTGMKKKKRKLIDARSKSYKEHRAKLEAARAKREAAKQAKFSEKVKESTTDFNVESLLAEDNVDVLRSIVKSKSMKPMKFKDGTMKVDLFTASAMMAVYKALKQPALKKKFEDMIKSKEGFMQTQAFAMKMAK